jgi:hypothetical protein
VRAFGSGLPFAVVTCLLAGCGGAAPPNAPAINAAMMQTERRASLDFKMPALVTFDTQSGALAYWPIERSGGRELTPISGSLGIDDGFALAANGRLMAIANYDPAEVVTYDLRTKVQTTIPDPYGQPYDIAIGDDATIYALNTASVTVYKPGSSQPAELTCKDITLGEAVAVDNEGDVFVNGYGGSFTGVIEYKAGSHHCTEPNLKPEQAYAVGVGVDPKTDDLIVLNAPGLCAGGYNGQMTIYPKPYRPKTAVTHQLATTYCAGTFRLNKQSTLIFYSDSTVSAGYPLIDEATYPDGTYVTQYENGYYSGGGFSGFTTIPNRLPN